MSVTVRQVAGDGGDGDSPARQGTDLGPGHVKHDSACTEQHALRVRMRTSVFRPFVRIEHRRHAAIDALLVDMDQQCRGEADFIDAMSFSTGSSVLSVARMADRAPWLGSRSRLRPDLLVMAAHTVDYQETTDFIWRFDRRRLQRVAGPQSAARLVDVLRWRLANRRKSVVAAWCEVCLPIGEVQGFLATLLGPLGVNAVRMCPLRRPASAIRSDAPLDVRPDWQAYLGFWHRLGPERSRV